MFLLLATEENINVILLVAHPKNQKKSIMLDLNRGETQVISRQK